MPLDLAMEAVGAKPNFSYDVIRPLLQGRVDLPDITLRPAGPFETAPFFDDARFRDGDFGLLDINWGDAIAASDAGWNLRWLPIFHKRKPIYSYLWVRSEIEKPRDLVGRILGTGSYRSAITISTRGALARFHGVGLGDMRILSNGRSPFPPHDPDGLISFPTDGKSPPQRLLDGEIDACTGDIIDPKLWSALESSKSVRRLFADYATRNAELWRTHRNFSAVHLFAIGGKLDDRDPGLALRLYRAFVEAKRLAYEDALGDGPSSSLLLGARETVRDQLVAFDDLFPYGIAANKTTIETFLDDNFQQGLTKTRLAADRLFATGTLAT